VDPANKSSADRPLLGRHAVVTGGGRGIGFAIAEALARRGANVTIMGRNRSRLDERVADLSKFGTQIIAEAVDVTDPTAIETAFASSRRRLGSPSILVNNAGIARSAPFAKTTLALWQEVLATDLTGAFLCIGQVLPGMINGDYGRIVNIASTAGVTGISYCTAYCSAKHGLIGMTRALAREVAKTPVTVNAVCPGYTDTDLTQGTMDHITSKTGKDRNAVLAQFVANNPQGRLIQPCEVAETVAWLCMPSSASITGQSILVAGGEVM
jgi:NAD(P)-dependent dehydrogenase (short-subunit alcohol dehydrogenase family)